MIDYDSRYDKIVFRGRNPLTGLPVSIPFNQPTRHRILMWNRLLYSWMLSRDAGLHWEMVRVSKEVPIQKIIENVDLVLIYQGEI